MVKSVSPEPPFNPLDKKNLGKSVAEALLDRDGSALPPGEPFDGAGIYAIYYEGTDDLYLPISRMGKPEGWIECPIYVGKAVPKGARKGGTGLDANVGNVLFKRLGEHAKSITATQTLRLDHFYCRFLAVDDILIPLGENLLIEKFKPLWNLVVEGFGNHDPGKGRREGKRSDWDVLHPGRDWAAKLRDGRKREEVIARITAFYKAHDLTD